MYSALSTSYQVAPLSVASFLNIKKTLVILRIKPKYQNVATAIPNSYLATSNTGSSYLGTSVCVSFLPIVQKDCLSITLLCKTTNIILIIRA